MSHWNYRVTEQQVGDETEYAIREVHYDDDDNVKGWTEEPITFTGDSPEEVAEALRLALRATEKEPLYISSHLPTSTDDPALRSQPE